MVRGESKARTRPADIRISYRNINHLASLSEHFISRFAFKWRRPQISYLFIVCFSSTDVDRGCVLKTTVFASERACANAYPVALKQPIVQHNHTHTTRESYLLRNTCDWHLWCSNYIFNWKISIDHKSICVELVFAFIFQLKSKSFKLTVKLISNLRCLANI